MGRKPTVDLYHNLAPSLSDWTVGAVTRGGKINVATTLIIQDLQTSTFGAHIKCKQPHLVAVFI